jgi:hypothetical protein
MKKGGIEMEEIGSFWLDRNYVYSRMRSLCFHIDGGADAESVRNLFVQLFDRVEALEKRLPQATTDEEKN